MELSEILPLVSRWSHIIAAIVLVGGTIFLRLAVVPVQNTGEISNDTFESVRKRWAKFVMLSVMFLLVSGLYNAAVKAIGYQLDSTYLVLLMAKIVLALVVFFLVSVLSGRSGMAQRLRAAGTKYYNVTILVMLLLVCIAGFMKMSPQPVKDRGEPASETAESSEETKTAATHSVSVADSQYARLG